MDLIFPFKVGEDAEAKSFTRGYRSSWFRCKIHEMKVRGDHLEYLLEYFDFPLEKLTWTRIDQVPPKGRKSQLMLRPPFPKWYVKGHPKKDDDEVADVTAVVKEAWKVGDLVDWWYADCYWSAKITKLLGDNKVQVELPNPPIGEGSSYRADCNDLRPSLVWSLEKGWTVPPSKANGKCWYTADLLHAAKADKGRGRKSVTNRKSNDPVKVEWFPDLKVPLDRHQASSHVHKENGKRLLAKEEQPVAKEEQPGSSLDVKVDHPQTAVAAKKRRADQPGKYQPCSPNRKGDSDDETPVRCPATLEETIMQLEELASYVRWLKGVLQFGHQWSAEMKPSWKMVENHGSVLQR